MVFLTTLKLVRNIFLPLFKKRKLMFDPETQRDIQQRATDELMESRIEGSYITERYGYITPK